MLFMVTFKMKTTVYRRLWDTIRQDSWIFAVSEKKLVPNASGKRQTTFLDIWIHLDDVIKYTFLCANILLGQPERCLSFKLPVSFKRTRQTKSKRHFWRVAKGKFAFNWSYGNNTKCKFMLLIYIIYNTSSYFDYCVCQLKLL